jgi:hypothetical protein
LAPPGDVFHHQGLGLEDVERDFPAHPLELVPAAVVLSPGERNGDEAVELGELVELAAGRDSSSE